MIYIDLKNVAGYFNEYFVYVLFAVLLIEFILGTTNKLYANSILEIPFRVMGWVSIRTFRMRHKKLDKKKGRRL
jgi:hypothetical protein